MIQARISRALYRLALWLYGIRPMPLPLHVRDFHEERDYLLGCPRPSTYRDPAPPPVEVASPPPPERPDAGARLVVLAGVLGFLIGYALAVMS